MSETNTENFLPEQCFDLIYTKGRPKKKLNALGQEIVIILAETMATEEQIAAKLNVSVDTLHNKENDITFSECYKKGQERGKLSLRQYQFNLAKTNATMAIWLGKQYLGQKDKTDNTDKPDGNTNKEELTIQFVDNSGDDTNGD